MKLLFVCTGNICRSPTAHGVFEHMAQAAGHGYFTIDSAGTHSYHVGEQPDSRTMAAALARGYDLSTQRARKVSVRDFSEFDLIFAMDKSHLSQLERICPPEHRHKLHLYLYYTLGHEGMDVPDPYYGGPEGFERVLDLAEWASEALLKKLTA